MGLYTILNATGQTINVTGLDGDLHGTYAVDGMLNMNSLTPTNVTFKLNGVTTHQYSVGRDDLHGAVFSSGGSLKFFGTDPVNFATPQGVTVNGTINARSGKIRSAFLRFIWNLNPGGGDAIFDSLELILSWNDTATNLTSLECVGSSSDAFAAGSFLKLTPTFAATANPAKIYVSPAGDDANDGLQENTAVQTGYVGYQKIVAAGGGHLMLADKSSWGGPVAGQGIWIRGDGKAIPGWLPAVPCVIEGVGAAPMNLFTRPGQALIKCGSNATADYRTKPGIWLAASDVNFIDFRNLRPIASDGYGGDADGPAAGLYGLYRSWRVGWDYPRKSSDGSIDYLQITSSQRAANLTTHTVALPNPGIAVSTAQRTAGIVRLTIPRPAGFASFPPYNARGLVWFESSDAHYLSGKRAITSQAWTMDITSDWSFSYDDSRAVTGTGTDHIVASTKNNQVGTWADLRISGKHPAGNRQMSPAFARFKNLIPPPASWSVLAGSMSTGHVDPMGGTGAVRLTDTGSGTVVALRSGTDTDTSFAAGGRYVIAGWINSPDAAFNPALLFQFFGGNDLVWTSTQNTVLAAMWYFACPAAIGGWQYVVMSDTLVSGSASQPYDVRIAGPLPATSKYMDVFGLSAFWIPPAVNDNDAAEFIGTLKAQPYYLAPGMAGTFENQKLILSPKPGRRWAWRSVKRALPILSSQLD